jgi:hypothetical protein
MRSISIKVGTGLLLLWVVLELPSCRTSGCTRTENCEECVARCVDTQRVSPDICRITACQTPCGGQE